MAIGYDDTLAIKNTNGGKTTTGALSYEYVLKGLAVDWWTLISEKYVETTKFGI